MLKSRRTNLIGIRDAACERANAALVACWRTSSQKRGFAMSKIAFFLTLFGALIVCLLPGAPAQAQENRTFVSSTGDDSNNCTNTATPCRHFAAAYAATPAGGEIDVLDPGNYGGPAHSSSIRHQGRRWGSGGDRARGATF